MSSTGAARSTRRTRAGVMAVRAAAAACATLLLAACGGGADAGSGGDAKAAWLAEDQVKAVLPDQAAMPGWQVTERPASGSMDTKLMVSQFCPGAGTQGCERSRFFGSAAFRRDDDKAEARFWLLTYQDELDAKAAYEVLWRDAWRKSGTENVDLGTVGRQRAASAGPAGRHGEAVTGQIRVGTAILWIGASGSTVAPDRLDKDFPKRIAALFAERAQQAQNGDKPSAALDRT
ncbi:hypothetical protein ACFVYE_12530 [Streptomyces sp. NPDC058239]|uniref:hypothetical protein n=1 Tax=unclassified Streptomyces TaxID=2593676 RepID=UPI003648CE3D